MIFGYLRVEAAATDVRTQARALRAAGCADIEQDLCDALVPPEQRAGFRRLQARLRRGDRLVMWRLDVLTLDLAALLAQWAGWQEQEIELQFLQEGLGPTTPETGSLIAALYAFSQQARQRRQQAEKRGRPRVLDRQTLERISRLRVQESLSATQIQQALGISKTTFYRYVRPDGTLRIDPSQL